MKLNVKRGASQCSDTINSDCFINADTFYSDNFISDILNFDSFNSWHSLLWQF